MFHPVIKLKVYNEDLVFGPGLITLLEYLRQTGSMKEACNGNVLQQRLEDHEPGGKRTGIRAFTAQAWRQYGRKMRTDRKWRFLNHKVSKYGKESK